MPSVILFRGVGGIWGGVYVLLVHVWTPVWSTVFPNCSPSYFWRYGLLLSLELANLPINWLTSKLYGSSYAHSEPLFQEALCLTFFYNGLWELNPVLMISRPAFYTLSHHLSLIIILSIFCRIAMGANFPNPHGILQRRGHFLLSLFYQ